MQYLSSQYRLLPEKPGVYRFLDTSGSVIYVGKAKSLRKRVSSYFSKQSEIGPKTQLLISKISKIEVTEVTSEIESLLLESALVKKHVPQFNIRLTDGKAYPLIRITKKTECPSVLISRRKDDPKSIYFGPFPNAGDMKLVLRTARRIFPFISGQNHPKKLCLYWHLRLCPCTPAFKTLEAKKEYRKTIRHIIDFLSGNIKKIQKNLIDDQKKAVKNEEFEKAGKIQRQILAISSITEPRTDAGLYEINPNLASDLRQKETEELKTTLNEHGLHVSSLQKIECYDISNISGKSATGSLVVFVNGEPDKSQYRRFKIRFTELKPNDFAMMKEVLSRRFRHFEWTYPDLIVIDGGKGQVSAATDILNNLELNTPLIGLAKRFETIVLPDFTEIKLSHRSYSIKLLQRIRNEAHRFAIAYHRKIRKTNAFL